ncbi:MAG: 4-hydroxythreonine-4-phosphate dehydrogenase PdxA, partial [Gammaproteobacteria bacterium]
VTAPVQKSVINEAGVAFTGHTEFLAEATGAALPVMMLASGDLRVALATTHLPLTEVASALSSALVEDVLAIIDRELRDRFRIPAPRLAVLGLNPPAGEQGVLGRDATTIIEPAMTAARKRDLELIGPLPADTAFTPNALEACDVILAMYHDQGLPAIKALAFGEVVNVTLGLPIVRTSVDHGTALALAATGDAKVDSLRAAISVAIDITMGNDA